MKVARFAPALLVLAATGVALAGSRKPTPRGGHAGYLARALPRPPRPPPIPPEAENQKITRHFLLGFVLPLWMAAGIADWFCHRRTDIAHTAGRKESLIHLLMLSQAAMPVTAALFLEITSPVLLLMFAAVMAHEATALWDVSYAVKRREVTPVEQHVHDYLVMVPVMAVSFVSVLYWPRVQALVGLGPEKRDWSIRRKRQPLPKKVVFGFIGAMVLLEWGPYLEELWRTQRARNEAARARTAYTRTRVTAGT